jgi:hypothetical protein
MPVISKFYGIVIRFYFLQSEHNPPHIHALYKNYAAAIELATGDVIDGNLPPSKVRLVKEWVNNHREELEEMWQSQVFKKIDPLK